MNRLVLDQLELGPADDVLEVGFGGAALLATIRAATLGRVYGVDLSADAVARAKRRLGEGVTLYEASVEAIPLPDGSVDKACSVSNIYFWSDPAAAMLELGRVTRPGGTLSICFEPPEELRKWSGHRHGFRLFEEEEVQALMEQAGFRSIRSIEGRGRKPDLFVCLTGERAETLA
ncbi:MAG: class I SAM-dependent methyltransferase [Pseudomonadota bacterium]|nr:class I SAM-dependent methyltransferase [Pseudomonadota bacterium]